MVGSAPSAGLVRTILRWSNKDQSKEANAREHHNDARGFFYIFTL